MKLRGKRSQRDSLLRSLDVDPEQMSQHPQITPRLKMNGVRPEYLVEVLRGDPRPESLTFVRKWDRLTPKIRETVGIEVVAISVGILPLRLWELFCGAELLQGKESAAVMIAMALPDVMRMTIKNAKKAKGLADREHFLKAARVLPVPKGSTTIINVPGGESGDDDRDDGKGDIEPADGFVLDASRVMNGPKALPAAQSYETESLTPVDSAGEEE